MDHFFAHTPGKEEAHIAYFSMEIGLRPEMPTYSGGLGVLAGDTIKSAADLRVPLVGMSILHEQGYFKQRLGPDGWQTEEPEQWDRSAFLVPEEPRVTVDIEGRVVHLRAWRADVAGVSGHIVPVYFLDTDLPENAEQDRALNDRLYGGDHGYRLRQEIILGVGGIRMLQALGYTHLRKYHMNEGHSALLIVELLRQSKECGGHYDAAMVKDCTVFTTHTPVAAGHDVFTRDELLKAWPAFPLDAPDVLAPDGSLNMTLLALNHAGYVNGVAKRHGEVSRALFPGYVIDSITNGIHSTTWTSPELAALYDRHIPGWRADPAMLRYAINIPPSEVGEAHRAAKARVIELVRQRTGVALRPDVLTIGFARRATAYKRAALLFTDPERLKRIADANGGLQIVFAGKAHVRDTQGKEIIKQIVAAAQRLTPHVTIVYLENYGMALARDLVAGVDVWLNTPLRPLEASGTSGMKAAHNGVPSLSVLDGWWLEGCLEGVTGWAVGSRSDDDNSSDRDARDAASLYDKLERVILPLYRSDPTGWSHVMRGAIALNASFFNTHRMVQEYVLRAYFN